MILTSHQPNFLPYMGVIYKAYKSNAIVLSDDVCYSKKGMHNWNVIRAKNGSQKITIPVNAHHDTKLCDIMISEPRKTLPKIVRTLEETYAKTRCFEEGQEILDIIRDMAVDGTGLTELNIAIIKHILDRMGIARDIAVATRDLRLTRKMGTMPHGNNNYGGDSAYTYEKGQESAKDNNKTGRTFTGSGPATWGHDHTQFGIQDMNGNVWEWLGGMRLNEGEIQIIPYNNAALGSECDMSASSTLWKAIKNDGSLVAPGTAATLKYDFVSGNIQLTTGITSAQDAGRGGSYTAMTLASGITAPELAKALILYPDEPGKDYGGDYHWMNNAGERLPIAGGYWNLGANAGVFDLRLNNARSNSYGGVGFRSAYVEL